MPPPSSPLSRARRHRLNRSPKENTIDARARASQHAMFDPEEHRAPAGLRKEASDGAASGAVERNVRMRRRPKTLPELNVRDRNLNPKNGIVLSLFLSLSICLSGGGKGERELEIER